MPRKNKTKAVQKPAGAEAECCQISGNLHENPIALAEKKMEGMQLYRQTVIDNVKRAAKDKFDCSGEDCRTSNCDIRRDLVDLDVNQKVIMRDLNIKAVQIDGLVEVLGVVNNTQSMLFKMELDYGTKKLDEKMDQVLKKLDDLQIAVERLEKKMEK